MFDRDRLHRILIEYKNVFESEWWPKEKYKWEAVKCFKDNWDINDEDFAEMLRKALAKTSNLLASTNNFPRQMLIQFAEQEPKSVQNMFIDLFDETKDIYERINRFKERSIVLLSKYNSDAKNHYQNENVITTYLWLRYPDKYYIYKFSEVKAGADELRSNYQFKKGAYAANIRNFYKFYDEIAAVLQQDTELVKLFQRQIINESDCYPDPQLRTLTIDVGFYISRRIHQRKRGVFVETWLPQNYTPGLSVDDWNSLLNDKEVFTISSLEIMKRIMDYGGQATCTQLVTQYGENVNFYVGGSIALARRIVQKTGCPVFFSEGEAATWWWPVLYEGKKADKDEKGVFVWRIREELLEALRHMDLSDVLLYTKTPIKQRQYWWLKANPKIWSFSNVSVGEVQAYTLDNERGNKRRVFQNFLEAKAGDLVIGYESKPVKQIVALGKIEAEQDGEKLYFKKLRSLPSPISYDTLKDCPELEHMGYFANPQGSLFKLTENEYNFIVDIIYEENSLPQNIKREVYLKKDFLDEVFMTESNYERLISVLKYKKNIILQGAPGVGKTFAAKRLAWSMMGEKDESRIEFVQFHQSYSYEEFMMGYKPVKEGFELTYGIFYRFCQKAADQPDKVHFFIIDEINRGNMSKIFGELLMLIEKDYRGMKATLAYNGIAFSVPENVYIIGMMNTADRSLAMIDYALRRRFSFFEMEPGFNSNGFIQYQQSLNNETLDELIERIKELNREITMDKSLGKGFCIGHSYFCGCQKCTEEWMYSIVEYEILPMLNEYWFDDITKLQRWENILRGVFQ